MDFISPLISIVDRLCTAMAPRISNVIHLDRRIQSFTTEVDELKDQRDDLRSRVKRAELDGSRRTNEIQRWLARVEVIEAEATSIIENLGQSRHGLGCLNATCCSKYNLSKEIIEKLKEIGELKRKGAFEKLVTEPHPAPVEEKPCRPAVGISLMLDKVWEFLEEDKVGIMALYGIGGVGKTTLLKTVNNAFLGRAYNYDVVIWVLVTKEFVVSKIQQAIVARLGLPWEETEASELRTSKIYNVLKKKRFLLLLDDIWERIDLGDIGIPLPNEENKCKLIFTTRSMDVCTDMDAHRKLKVEFLDEEKSWQLFCEKVGRMEILESPPIRNYAETIVRKCGGLPLALITVGRAMANKETEEEWKYAIELLNKSPSELRGMEDVFTLLRFSYDNLENETTKTCLLYCALFPESYSIEKEQLVEYWIGEGFLDSSYDSNAHNKGYAAIGSLKVACLLETGEEETQVKMNDVIRSFALWIASESGLNKGKFLIEASSGLTEAPGVKNWEGAERISLLDNGITVLKEIHKCPNLLTLLLQWNNGLNRVSADFFQSMSALRVLDLSFTSIRKIPVSINQLVELRHLNLAATKITTLPKELGSLTKLNHLNLLRTYSLRTVPREAISGLADLAVLNLYYSYSWEVQNVEGEAEVGFEELETLRHLRILGLTISTITSLNRLSGLRNLVRCIQYLHIKECEGLPQLELSSASGYGKTLRRLSIRNCYDLNYLVVDAEDRETWLPNLEVLALQGLPNVTSVWKTPVRKVSLQNLRLLNIWYCHRLKNVSWVLLLPRLEVIYLFYCKEMEELVSGEEKLEPDSQAFSRLKTISIRDLPELRSITPWALAFPCLKSIAVIDCPQLKKLPIRNHNSSNLPTVYCAKDWWDGLEWDEPNTKYAFLTDFTSN
ncbi:NB-ARC domain-containing disease resistance protein, putative [Theobroma cacao]|uniref:NB-ARC domain-containing disease resistance protein, putative n=1 Tax=Theobroma cacao TaxID=3641 RepID=A0A061GMK9_THECC|nr:NB-ARC domain-containing disease resistance protein, putative [Theobroma cacao]